jgi:hypothetical protein
MRWCRSTAVLAVLLGSVLASSTAHAQEAVTGHAELHPVNQSGVRGSVDFTETDAGVRVTGTATGLQPSAGRYISLVYDLGSVPGGPIACEPSPDDPVGPVGMFVGSWVVDSAGNGILVQTNPAVASLALIDSVSIRDTQINKGFGPEAVVACGQIAVRTGR